MLICFNDRSIGFPQRDLSPSLFSLFYRARREKAEGCWCRACGQPAHRSETSHTVGRNYSRDMRGRRALKTRGFPGFERMEFEGFLYLHRFVLRCGERMEIVKTQAAPPQRNGDVGHYPKHFLQGADPMEIPSS